MVRSLTAAGPGEGAESPTFRLAGSRKSMSLGLAWASETPKFVPNDTLLLTRPQQLQQGQIS